MPLSLVLTRWVRVDKCKKYAYDNEIAEKLWNILEETVMDKQVLFAGSELGLEYTMSN